VCDLSLHAAEQCAEIDVEYLKLLERSFFGVGYTFLRLVEWGVYSGRKMGLQLCVYSVVK